MCISRRVNLDVFDEKVSSPSSLRVRVVQRAAQRVSGRNSGGGGEKDFGNLFPTPVLSILVAEMRGRERPGARRGSG